MRNFLILSLTLAWSARLTAVDATTGTLCASTSKQTGLLELYSSEGCSSCPPAERWMSQLKNDPRLWKELVPVSFHVDYWDNSGWKDRFASAEWTKRQKDYAAAWGSSGVYTPQFILNGHDWRKDSAMMIPAVNNAGVLTVNRIGSNAIVVIYRPGVHLAENYKAHLCVLGFDLKSHVNGGENSGHELTHDFVALQSKEQILVAGGENECRAVFQIHSPDDSKNGLAVWISADEDIAPLQATGCWLP
jgi:hypothetical protein